MSCSINQVNFLHCNCACRSLGSRLCSLIPQLCYLYCTFIKFLSLKRYSIIIFFKGEAKHAFQVFFDQRTNQGFAAAFTDVDGDKRTDILMICGTFLQPQVPGIGVYACDSGLQFWSSTLTLIFHIFSAVQHLHCWHMYISYLEIGLNSSIFQLSY